MKANVSIAKMRKDSGGVTSKDKIVQLFYLLLRDHLTASQMEKLVDTISEKEAVFTNGWIANYSKYLAKRVKNAKKTRK